MTEAVFRGSLKQTWKLPTKYITLTRAHLVCYLTSHLVSDLKSLLPYETVALGSMTVSAIQSNVGTAGRWIVREVINCGTKSTDKFGPRRVPFCLDSRYAML